MQRTQLQVGPQLHMWSPLFACAAWAAVIANTLKSGADWNCGAGVAKLAEDNDSVFMCPFPFAYGTGVGGSDLTGCEQQDDAAGAAAGAAGAVEEGCEQQDDAAGVGAGAGVGPEQQDWGGCGSISTGSVVTCRPRATRSWKKMGCVSSSGVGGVIPLL